MPEYSEPGRHVLGALKAQHIPGKGRDEWQLQCETCSHPFSDEITIEQMLVHFEIFHESDEIHLKLAWVGAGPEPDRTANRSQRRRGDQAEARRKRRMHK